MFSIPSTCVGAKWNCKLAPAKEEVCGDNEKLTTCEPVERQTCQNKNKPLEGFSPAVCLAACVCKKGYIFDVSTNKCILPTECPCHHGGKTYTNGQTIAEDDCNTCQCNSGEWTCTKNSCSSTCSAWGDSHFHTFDGILFDFEGVCSYTLSQGKLPSGDGYTIDLQNRLCGLDGVTCSKSIKITLSGSSMESLVLEQHLPIPGIGHGGNKKNSTFNQIYKHLVAQVAGIFVVVEAKHLGIQIKWDRGTRIYVTLEKRWMGRTEGLCGNFNKKSNDDMKTKSGAIENSAARFGHSWRSQSNCAGEL